VDAELHRKLKFIACIAVGTEKLTSLENLPHLFILMSFKTKDPSEPRALPTPSCPGAYHPLRGASQSAGDMKFTDDGTIAILSPTEMREARHLCGWTLATLSRYAEISIAQLSTYENGLSGLRADQVRLCMELLLGGIAERAEQIQNLIATAQQKRRTSLPSDMPSQSQSR
jgi:hypothetical protein